MTVVSGSPIGVSVLRSIDPFSYVTNHKRDANVKRTSIVQTKVNKSGSKREYRRDVTLCVQE